MILNPEFFILCKNRPWSRRTVFWEARDTLKKCSWYMFIRYTIRDLKSRPPSYKGELLLLHFSEMLWRQTKVNLRLTGNSLLPLNRPIPQRISPRKLSRPQLQFINAPRLVLQRDLNITVNADDTLSSFCKWQMGLNHADDSHPNHHDVAILVTR